LNWLQWLSTVKVPEQSRWVLDRHVANYFRLRGEIKIVEGRLAEVTADNALVQRLQTMKAIGPVTSSCPWADMLVRRWGSRHVPSKTPTWATRHVAEMLG